MIQMERKATVVVHLPKRQLRFTTVKFVWLPSWIATGMKKVSPRFVAEICRDYCKMTCSEQKTSGNGNSIKEMKSVFLHFKVLAST